MPKNLTLKLAIFASGLRQIEVAKAAEMHESRLSHIINGHRVANDVEQKALARVLKRTRRQLGFRAPKAGHKRAAGSLEERVAS